MKHQPIFSEFPVPPAPQPNISMAYSPTKTKRSLKHAVSEAKYNHSQQCPGAVPILLGLEDDFALDYENDDKLIHWIEDGYVYALIKCPDGEHEELSRGIIRDIMVSLERAQGQYFSFRGSTRTPIRNSHGCHSVFEKEPDESIVPFRIHAGCQRRPLIILEVASRHETMHMLMCQMASWLQSPSDVRVAVAVNLRHLSTGFVVEIFVFISNLPNRDTPEDLDKEAQLKEIISRRKSGLDVSSKVEGNRFCDPLTSIDYRDRIALLENYGLDLLWYASFDKEPENSVETFFCMDLNHLLAKTTMAPSQRWLVINFYRTLREFFINRL